MTIRLLSLLCLVLTLIASLSGQVSEKKKVLAVGMSQGWQHDSVSDALATIYNLHGEPQQEVRAPCRGVNFGMRTQPATHVGDWAVFWGKVTGTIS